MIGDRWGVRDDEIRRHYPCDDLVAMPVPAAYRGITVHAPSDRVWSWVSQIRLASYSYDWIDNLGRRSPQQLRGLPEPVAGEPYSIAFGRPAGRILSVTPGEQLTGRIMGATMSYVLVPEGSGTRLLLKVLMGSSRLVAPLLSVGDLLMARRQLINLKHLAERGDS